MLLNIEQLKALVVGDTVAIRGVATLEPAGGPGDKIFPPTHAVYDNNPKPGAKYAFETRRGLAPARGNTTPEALRLDRAAAGGGDVQIAVASNIEPHDTSDSIEKTDWDSGTSERILYA